MVNNDDQYSKTKDKQELDKAVKAFLKKGGKIEKSIDANILKTQERLEKILGLKVNILNKKNKLSKSCLKVTFWAHTRVTKKLQKSSILRTLSKKSRQKLCLFGLC